MRRARTPWWAWPASDWVFWGVLAALWLAAFVAAATYVINR